ncbi:MAG: GNAT family N-acetyltransferase [Gammaproteobacteria bacterium]|nr:GNAT family N-acetyltransferase [Gammaproteobacteria bacterium]
MLIARPLPDETPWPLLLDADPSRERIEGYLNDELTRVAKFGDVVVGVYVMVWIDRASMELKNIAVRTDCQGQGLGRWLLGHALGLAESKGARRVEVGTGNSSLDNLEFYQRGGFRIVGVIPDFFTDNYPQPIIEDGIVCRDMVRLAFEVTPD